MDRRTLILGVGGGLAALGGYAVIHPMVAGTPPLLSVGAAHAQDSAPQAGADTAPNVVEMALGDPDAPVEVIEYASFTCPHCRRFHEDVLPQIKANYIDQGHVRFIVREVYANRPALWAGMVARCAGAERYFGVVDLIFSRQSEWTQGSPVEIAENLRRIGRLVGLDDARLDACLTDADMAQALVDASQAHAQVHDIPGTPSFVIDGELYSNMDYERFASILDDRLQTAE